MKTSSTVFLVTAIMITLLSNKCTTKSSLLWQEILIMFLSVTQSLNQFHGTFHGLKIASQFNTWHGNCLLTGFDFYIKILLVTINFLFCILLCYLLNLLFFCIGNISWYCFLVTLFCCSSHVPPFRGSPIVLPVFDCMFPQCSGVPPVFRVPQFHVPGFIVYLSRAHISKSKTCFSLKSSTYYFHYEDEDIERFSNLH